MLIENILLIILLFYLIIAIINDIKKREVPDFISFSLIFIILGLKALNSIILKDLNYFLLTLLGLALFFILANIMYYTKIWGGGDTKLLIGLGALFITYPKSLLNYFNPNLNYPFLLILFINLLLIGSIYGLTWSLILAIKNKNFLKEFKRSVRKSNLSRKLSLIFALIIIIFIFLQPELKIVLLLLALTILFYPYLLIFVQSVEKTSMMKYVNTKELTEGDWVAHDIIIKNKKICSKKDLGLTKKQITTLIKNKVKKVLIKQGIPFTPAFLIAIILSLIFGNIITL